MIVGQATAARERTASSNCRRHFASTGGEGGDAPRPVIPSRASDAPQLLRVERWTTSSFYAPGHIGKPCAPRPRERLWRLPKNHRTVDAELLYDAEYGVEVQFLYNGELAYGRRWTTRGLAVDEASDKHQELERAGWTAHW